MIVVEEEHNEEPKGSGYECPFQVEGPEVDQPISRLGRVEGFGNGDTSEVSVFDVPGYMREANPKDSGKL